MISMIDIAMLLITVFSLGIEPYEDSDNDPDYARNQIRRWKAPEEKTMWSSEKGGQRMMFHLWNNSFQSI